MALQPLLINQTVTYINNLIDKAKITIDDVTEDYPIYNSLVEGNSIKKYVYLDNATGYISEAKLVDSLGRDLSVKPLKISKGQDGFMMVFLIELNVKEVE
ncbi:MULTISPECIES: hypothetical protein [Pontibacillus]|uniref:Uncharacterized protein n=1 Tax=Pontibacillus chungwhensis TaxID=265426 RepID=A0ABY8V178_9BACI|nr:MULTISPECIES: hypothetical protein [Pontibacillus]MCD5324787.1 hypothetical protein [Pontibacillus sp. HN14]WIF98746.1 hypothetical protein QNI29_03585 [Pontibacillus chungwhensis]